MNVSASAGVAPCTRAYRLQLSSRCSSSSGSTILRNLGLLLNRRTAPIHSLSDARGSAGDEPPRQLGLAAR